MGLFGSKKPIRLALVGLGKIARDQHLPAIAGEKRFRLVAAADPAAKLDGLDVHPSQEAMLAAVPGIDAVVLCTPAEVRWDLARKALTAGKHVLLEKPPCDTVSAAESLTPLGASGRPTLFAAWHSRFAPAVELAREWLARREVVSVVVAWREDVRYWHPGQAWIWQAGGFGVFDPGVNALSILTHILPGQMRLRRSELSVPSNCETPILADLLFELPNGAPVKAVFDFQGPTPPTWEIAVRTADGHALSLLEGGARMQLDGREAAVPSGTEYAGLYGRFADLIGEARSDFDLSPLRHVADAFLLGRRREVEPFVE